MLSSIHTNSMYGGGSMTRNKYPEETVNLILDVATKLFIKQGYEHTSIQDIINGLGGLSKGAIYHHFKSKEDILQAMGDRLGKENAVILGKIRDDTSLNGKEKLKAIYRMALSAPNQDIMISVAPNIMNNPRFLVMQIQAIYDMVAPDFIQPILEQGARDGSLRVKHPKELAEAMMLLTNIWLNPMMKEITVESQIKKCEIFNDMLKDIGIELIDQEMIQLYINYCAAFQEHK